MIALVTASEAARAQVENEKSKRVSQMYPRDIVSASNLDISPLEDGIIEGENPVSWSSALFFLLRTIYVHRVELFGIATLTGW